MAEAFKDKYGPWGLVAGASVGLGAAFAEELASRGLNLVLIARRLEPLKELGERLKDRYGIDVRQAQQDLASPDLIEKLSPHTDDIEIGLMVYDTAFHTIGPFLQQTLENHLRHIEVNCRGPFLLTYHFGRKMVDRGRAKSQLADTPGASQRTKICPIILPSMILRTRWFLQRWGPGPSLIFDRS